MPNHYIIWADLFHAVKLTKCRINFFLCIKTDLHASHMMSHEFTDRLKNFSLFRITQKQINLKKRAFSTHPTTAQPIQLDRYVFCPKTSRFFFFFRITQKKINLKKRTFSNHPNTPQTIQL